ncbi:ABC transporter ATP-binding protein [Bisgaard Taxon 10/6]|uniref:ABC transporter ATP-binding protein n=1 Tax=Exercitatus varius TaxID=67857 RepID=A0ABT6EUS4_9PAST|nr:ABC transporter ATP-binding protein [Exercitatus varius]MDG2939789.1 ABC transporter ATP-binding protein [Exercitatus varius]MDG2946473.1 ABC transporter ATP-binding protein [Exercitatus varius]
MENLHSQICQPVANRLRLSMWLATLAQGLKLVIWIQIIVSAQYLNGFPFASIGGLFFLTVLYYTCKIKAHDQSHYAAFALEQILRQELADKMAKLPLGKVREIGSGALAKVLFDDVRELHAFVADAPPLRAEAYSTPVFVLVALFWLDWHLALSVFVFVALLFVILQRLLSRSQLSRREYAAAMAQVNSTIVEYVQGMSAIRTFDAGQSSYGRFTQALARFNAVMFDWIAKVGFPTRFARTLFTPMPIMLFLILIGTYFHRLEWISTFTLFAFLVLAAGLIETMHPYMSLFQLLEKSRAAIERINEIKTMEILTALLPSEKPKNYRIAFNNVSFRYDGQSQTVINRQNFVIPEGSFTAVIGSSGSGKTTLINLLLRFWDVTEGEITLGGVNIKRIEQAELMSLCSVVFQDNFLFSCSIAENIAYGLDNVNDAQIIEAAKQARIHDFIMTLADGYQTKVGERGQLLSGGQKQRITIARAFLQNRPILILDEPTAFSDAKNETDLMQAFHQLMKNKTVIMIAHRLSSIRRADQILYLERGNIIARGSHEELMTTSGDYQKLWAEYRRAQQWTM